MPVQYHSDWPSIETALDKIFVSCIPVSYYGVWISRFSSIRSVVSNTPWCKSVQFSENMTRSSNDDSTLVCLLQRRPSVESTVLSLLGCEIRVQLKLVKCCQCKSKCSNWGLFLRIRLVEQHFIKQSNTFANIKQQHTWLTESHIFKFKLLLSTCYSVYLESLT